MTLRDELAAVLGPGNNDVVAYQQADAVLEILLDQGSDLIAQIDYATRHKGDPHRIGWKPVANQIEREGRY